MALIIKHGLVSPIGPQENPRVCECCGRDGVARWILKRSENPEMWCANCFLYNTEWGKQNASERDRLIGLVENEIGSKITDQNGRLTDDGADRIMVSTLMISAYKLGRERAQNSRS